MSAAGKCFDCGRPGLTLEGALCRVCRRDREVYGRDTLGLPELVTCEECQGLEALCNECGGYGVVPVAEPDEARRLHELALILDDDDVPEGTDDIDWAQRGIRPA